MSCVLAVCSLAAILAMPLYADGDGFLGLGKKQDPCECLEQGMGLPKGNKCFSPAYNAPASIALNCSWDMDIHGSFLYWHVSEESLALANTNIVNQSEVFAFPDFKYERGFKAGMGWATNYDGWVSWVDYTWMHHTTRTSSSPPALSTGAPGTWQLTNWMASGSGPVTAGNAFSSTWKMHLDMVDAALSRPFYQGRRLTLSPYGGLRALWIRQRLDLSLTNQHVVNSSQSWSVGPLIGSTGNWLFGGGVRVEGKAAASMLYTQYSLAHKEANPPTLATVAYGRIKNYHCLRPTAELGLGLGWGTYLDCQQFYLDFSARYDFLFFWTQNMMQFFVSNGTPFLMGDLMLHGLTLTGRIDF